MNLHIWSDNETDEDLLGFQVHADLIRTCVTDQRILPLVLGVFGDWGGGKSSIMRMLHRDLSGGKYPNTVAIFFNGWMFEGYEDAKTALLSSILLQLGEHKKFGPMVKDKVVSLLRRVRLMEVAKVGVKHVGVPLALAALTGGAGGAASSIGSVAGGIAKATVGTAGGKRGEGTDDSPPPLTWSELIESEPGKPDLLEVRKFRDEFASMLAKTEIESLVIMIDDLDRCLPERIIETLEAIKLFVAVPKTACIIGADPRIVRHAIATRYVNRAVDEKTIPSDERYDLVKDYLEKLIQVPYYLPRLSPSEIETYMNLLACQSALKSPDFEKILDHWRTARKENLYAAYQQGAISSALGEDDATPQDLSARLAWSNAIADVVTDGLKGNPRQVKRMLNAMALRKQLADIAQMRIRDEVLAKLMVLEYSNLSLFQELNAWQSGTAGFPQQLKELEEAALDVESSAKTPEGVSSGWLGATAQNWLRMQPRLSDVDLRDYFWLARDRTSSTLTGVAMIPPIVRRLFESLVSDNRGEQKRAAKELLNVGETERGQVLSMLQRQIERHPERSAYFDVLVLLVEEHVPGAGNVFVSAVKSAPRDRLEPGIAFKLKMLTSIAGDHQEGAKALLKSLAKDTSSKVGKAAAKAIQNNHGNL